MRDYGKVSPAFWTGDTGREIRALGRSAQVVALYLMTAPGSNMIGLYYMPLPVLAHETGIPIEGASKALRSLCGVSFCDYDPSSEHVWVRTMVVHQLGTALKAGDKRIKYVRKLCESLIKTRLYKDFHALYGQRFGFQDMAPVDRPLKAPSKPPRSQEQEQEQEQEMEQEQLKDSRAVARAGKPDTPAGTPAWDRYAAAYRSRYSVEPVRNARTNALCLQLVHRLGASDAPSVAGFYPSHPDSLYTRSKHPLELLVRDAEKIRTEWATGNLSLGIKAQQDERLSHGAQIAQELKRELSNGK